MNVRLAVSLARLLKYFFMDRFDESLPYNLFQDMRYKIVHDTGHKVVTIGYFADLKTARHVLRKYIKPNKPIKYIILPIFDGLF